MKTQIQNLFIALVLLLPLAAQAQFTFVTNNGAITITGYTGSGGAVVIPAATNGFPVTSIGFDAFDSATMTSVTIPDSVTSIGDYAFYGCTSLTSVTIPDSVTSIGGGAFENCTSLTNITVGAGNPAYSSANGVLFDKNQTTLIQYPDGLGGSYTIPNSVTSIGDSAFQVCAGLTSVTIPNSVTSIGVEAFSDCRSLTNITVGAGNPAYSSADGVLFDKNQTTLIQYPGGLGGSYTIPNSVTSIGYKAFELCAQPDERHHSQ